MQQRTNSDQILLRMPPGLRASLAERAAQTRRSVSAEIIDAIEKHLSDGSQIEQILARLDRLERRYG